MPVMLQVRNLPDDVHAKLKARAREERLSLSDYVARELSEIVATRSNREIFEWAGRTATSAVDSNDVMEAVHAGRLDGGHAGESPPHPIDSDSSR
jgi:plasmid stability protein